MLPLIQLLLCYTANVRLANTCVLQTTYNTHKLEECKTLWGQSPRGTSIIRYYRMTYTPSKQDFRPERGFAPIINAQE